MSGFASTFCALAFLAGDHHPPAPVATPAQEARIRELVAVLSQRDASSPLKKDQSELAVAELVGMGSAAAAPLIRVVAAAKPSWNGTVEGHGPRFAVAVLKRLGRAAVGPVRAAWGNLTEAERWKLMAFRGKHDYDAALPFALESLDSRDEWVLVQAIAYAAEHREAKASKRLQAILNTAPAALRWDVVTALSTVGGEGAADALIPLLAGDSWLAKGEGRPMVPGIPVSWWPDGRPGVIWSLSRLKAAEAAPAMLKVLRERGDGRAYLGEFVIPFLAEHGGLECVPELRRIAASPRGEWGSPREAAEIKAAAARAADRIEGRNG